jgi:hypothetical protein
MPRSGVAVPRGETGPQQQSLPTASDREAFVSGSFGPDESVFERFGRDGVASERLGRDGVASERLGHDGVASERFRSRAADSESYRVEVDRYWRRTAKRRAAAEARRADGFARAERAVVRARRAEQAEPVTRDSEFAAPRVPPPLPPAAQSADPYREMLHAWARETAQEPPVAPGRRTVSIKGHGAEGYASRNGVRASAAERHRHLPRHERSGFQPDRVAMWAVLLGMMMVLAAAASAHAAVIAHHVH